MPLVWRRVPNDRPSLNIFFSCLMNKERAHFIGMERDNSETQSLLISQVFLVGRGGEREPINAFVHGCIVARGGT